MSGKEHDHPQRWSTAQARSPPLAHRRGPCPAPALPGARALCSPLRPRPGEGGNGGGEGWYLRAPPSPGGQRLKETEMPGLGFPTLSLCSRGDTEVSEGDKKGCRAAPGEPPVLAAGSSGSILRPPPAGWRPAEPPAGPAPGAAGYP